MVKIMCVGGCVGEKKGKVCEGVKARLDTDVISGKTQQGRCPWDLTAPCSVRQLPRLLPCDLVGQVVVGAGAVDLLRARWPAQEHSSASFPQEARGEAGSGRPVSKAPSPQGSPVMDRG